MKQICCSILSEGGYEPLGYIRSYLREVAINSNSTSYTPIISIRLNPLYKKFAFLPVSIELLTTSGTTIFYQASRNPVLTSPSWQDTSGYVQIDTTASALTGGYVIDTGFLSTSSRGTFQGSNNSVLNFQSNIDGVCDILTISAKSSSGINKDVYGSIVWRELV